MKKRFRSKKKIRIKFLKYFLFIFSIYLSYQVVNAVSLNQKLSHSNEEFIRAMLQDSNHHLLYEESSKNIINRIIRFISNVDFSKPETIVSRSFGYHLSYNHDENGDEEVSADGNYKDLENISRHIEDPYPVNISNPRVYIYNSHQKEEYSNKGLEAFNINPNVLMASYFLKEKLNKIGIPTVAEGSNIIDFMNANGWGHNESYKASRFYIIDALNKYENLDLLIDLHRDSISKDKSTITINGKKYAKTLFVVGANNTTYSKNLELANSIHKLIEKRYPGLSRGVMKKEGTNNNSIYNQDLSSKMILLEVGGYQNQIDEVLNTVEAISLIIKEFLEE